MTEAFVAAFDVVPLAEAGAVPSKLEAGETIGLAFRAYDNDGVPPPGGYGYLGKWGRNYEDGRLATRDDATLFADALLVGADED